MRLWTNRLRTFPTVLLLAAAGASSASAQLSSLPLLRPADSVGPVAPGPSLAPVVLEGAYRTGWSDDRDNGPLWAGRGAALGMAFGVTGRWGPLSVTLRPEVTWAENKAFPVAPRVGPGPPGSGAPWFAIDLPRRWGEGSRWAVFPGASTISVRAGTLSAGVSSATMVRGPELRYPVILGRSGPGVPHAFLDWSSTSTRVGRLAGRVQWGLARESEFFDIEEDDEGALLSGFFLDWTPPWSTHLVLGASLFYRDPLDEGFGPSLLFKAFTTDPDQEEEGASEENGLAAVHARWDGHPLSLWATYGRDDYARNVEDFVTEPGHAVIFALGAALSWETGATDWLLFGEVGDTGGAGPARLGIGGYRHKGAGHTHRGQILGASIGPSSLGTVLALERRRDDRTVGAEVERIVHDQIVHARIFDRRDGGLGQDREWRAAGSYRGPIPGVRRDDLRAAVRLGAVSRWNRDYLQYAVDPMPLGFRETNLILDLTLTWDPRIEP